MQNREYPGVLRNCQEYSEQWGIGGNSVPTVLSSDCETRKNERNRVSGIGSLL